MYLFLKYVKNSVPHLINCNTTISEHRIENSFYDQGFFSSYKMIRNTIMCYTYLNSIQITGEILIKSTPELGFNGLDLPKVAPSPKKKKKKKSKINRTKEKNY